MENNLIKKCMDATILQKEKEKERILGYLMRIYGDRFSSEGLSEYERRMEELDSIFDEAKERRDKEDGQ
jgi:hypothetical protein